MKKLINYFMIVCCVMVMVSIPLSADTNSEMKFDKKAGDIFEQIEEYNVSNINHRSIVIMNEEQVINEQANFKKKIIEKNIETISQMSEEMRDKVLDAIMTKEVEINNSLSSNNNTRGINIPSDNTNKVPNWGVRAGNILYTNIQKTNLFPHGHVALISSKNQYVLEATTTANNGAKVFEWHYNNLWRKGTAGNVWELMGTQQVKNIGHGAVKPLTINQRLQIVNYARSQVGKPYGLKDGLNNTSSFYCSKLVHHAFASATPTHDILKISSDSKTWGIVLPSDIAYHYPDVVWQKIGYRDVGTYK